MFQLTEIFNSIYKNRNKSIIAGITVAWGVILLILLVGTGKGLQNGVKKLFSDFTIKTLEVYAGEASISDVNVTKGDFISFTPLELKLIQANFNSVTHISPVVHVKAVEIKSERRSTRRFSLQGVDADYFKIKTLTMLKGRVFNSRDQHRNVVVIGYDIAKKLFNNSNCVGKLIFIKNIGYKIIGVIGKGNMFSSTGLLVYMPYDNALNQNANLHFDEFILSLEERTDTEEFQKTLKAYLSKKKGLNPNDKTVLFFNNIESTLRSFNTLFNAISLFLWFIGLSFLVSGMLGIFNIMTVIVRDRIGEFGIRKAVGASPKSIQMMVLMESLIITLVFGILGLIIGFALIYMINLYISINGGNSSFMILDINIYIILAAIVLLIISGCIAGIIPARKASKTLPVEALKSLNN